MAGIFGIVSDKRCIDNLFYGTFYLQHRAQDYCGLALYDGKRLKEYTHAGLIKQKFPKEELTDMKGNCGIGSVSSQRQPVSELGKIGGIIMCFDGNLINHERIKEELLKKGATFSGYYSPEEVTDTVLISKIISNEANFGKGIEKLVQSIEGDFAIIALAKEGIYAARGYGRKPLILGKKEGGYAVSSESNSFDNLEIEIVRDVEPGEIVLLDKEGIHNLKKLNLQPIKYGTFEWIYTAYRSSVIDKRSVAEVRERIGKLLARRYPVEADIVSPVPNSGRGHAIGYAKESGIKYDEVFARYDYSDRSYTPKEQVDRDEEARIKLVPIISAIKGKRIILIDDSIVRGTQTLNQVERLRDLGAKEVHARIACPPLMAACKYGKTTKKDEECIATRMSVEEIRKKLELDTLGYAKVEDLEEAIGFPRDMLCLECWES